MSETTPQRSTTAAEHTWRNHLDAANQTTDLFDRLRDELTEDPEANAPALALLLTLEDAVNRSAEHAYTAVQLLTTATDKETDIAALPDLQRRFHEAGFYLAHDAGGRTEHKLIVSRWGMQRTLSSVSAAGDWLKRVQRELAGHPPR